MSDTAHLSFHRRPAPVLADHRPLYKMAQVVLVLSLASRGGKSGLPRLHLFNWCLKNAARIRALSQAVTLRRLTMVTWGFDPALAVALRFLFAEGLLIDEGTKVSLSADGVAFAAALMEDKALLAPEKRDLALIGKGVTEAMVDAIAKEWRRA